MFKRISLILIVCFIATFGFAATASKTTWAPVAQTGSLVPEVDLAGMQVYRIAASSIPVMVNYPSKNAHSGKANPAPYQEVLVYGVSFSSLTANTAGTYIILRDTNVAGLDLTAAICPEIYASQCIPSATVAGQGTNSYWFPHPIRCNYGLSAAVMSALNTIDAGATYVYYRFVGKEKY